MHVLMVCVCFTFWSGCRMCNYVLSHEQFSLHDCCYEAGYFESTKHVFNLLGLSRSVASVGSY